MKKKEIKLKIETDILDKAKEYDINLEGLLSIAVMRQVNEIRESRTIKDFIRRLDEEAIINIIWRISKKDLEFNYASKSKIIADAKEASISKKRTIDLLNRLEEKEIIYQLNKDNYRVTKKKL
jgi:DNA replicative helicase MCM subunit Mcm2 (Cdc46/Mcm family)